MNPGTLNPASLCAIIVSYHPDAEFPARLAAVARQVGTVIVVDNASTHATIADLQERSVAEKFSLIVNPDNLGIARALNIGVQHAISLGYAWVLLFDQDTCVNDNLVAGLITVHTAVPKKIDLAVIGSHFHDINRPSLKPAPGPSLDSTLPPCPANLWKEVDWVITSGSLISIAAYQNTGPFRDDFFIDFVDTEYCMRARKLGYHIIRTTAPLMSHAIGKHSQHQLLGMRKWTSNHSPDRRYYITRNYTVLLRESGDYPYAWWAIKGLMASSKSLKRIILHEHDKSAKLIAVFHGWWDGVRGKMGKRGG